MSPIPPATRLDAKRLDAKRLDAKRLDVHMLLPAVLAVTLALAIASINPVGYIGGGSDDWQYLEAARCALREGFCVPLTHWAARLPLVLPTAAVLSVLGESRAHIMLVPIAYGLAAVLLFEAGLDTALTGDPSTAGRCRSATLASRPPKTPSSPHPLSACSPYPPARAPPTRHGASSVCAASA